MECYINLWRSISTKNILKSKIEINNDILSIESVINNEFSELPKYIGEMSVKISYKIGDEISAKNLKEYYNPLNKLIEHYALSFKK